MSDITLATFAEAPAVTRLVLLNDIALLYQKLAVC